VANVGPDPIGPSRSDSHAIEAVRSPSSGSSAIASKLTLTFSVAEPPSAGPMIVISGVAFGASVSFSSICRR